MGLISPTPCTSSYQVHTGRKPFACNQCEYSCSTADNLKTHMMTHTGEKPFACAVCDFKSRRAQCIRKHMLTHTGIKPFPCDVCNQRFTTSSHLKRHMMTHTGESAFYLISRSRTILSLGTLPNLGGSLKNGHFRVPIVSLNVRFLAHAEQKEKTNTYTTHFALRLMYIEMSVFVRIACYNSSLAFIFIDLFDPTCFSWNFPHYPKNFI